MYLNLRANSGKKMSEITKFSFRWNVNGEGKSIEGVAKEIASFGHHTTKPDMQILVEPIHSMTMDHGPNSELLQLFQWECCLFDC